VDRRNDTATSSRDRISGRCLTESLVEGIASAFAGFSDRYGGFFQTRSRDNAAVAGRYLSGLAQARDCTFAAMAAVVDLGCAQQFQHFISNSPWQHDAVVAQIGQDADRLLGGKPDSCLIIDESSFAKQGDRSVGVARQWSGRQGKIDNCQVAVFGVLSDGQRHAPVDMRLYLPKSWTADPARCERAGVPAEARTLTSKSEHALEIVRQARARGMRFGWVGADAGYGKEPAFLRALDEMNEVFVADVHKSQRIWTERPDLVVPPSKPGRGRPVKTRQASAAPVTVEALASGFGAGDWLRCELRDSTRGALRVDIAHRRVWLWDGEEDAPRCWHLIVRREVKSEKTVKYSLSNAAADTPVLRLAKMQGQRFWIERTFEDAKGECGLADYQALGWRAWHHHVTMVMLAMLFIAEQRAAHQPGLHLLTPRDIVEMLRETLPRKPEGKDALIERINQRHQRRRGAIESRYRKQQREAPS
jgi:SRSO17 transposase